MLFAKNKTQITSVELDSRLPQLFEALSDSRRYEIMKLLIKRADLCVSQIADVFRITVSAASQQLKFLEMAGLIRRLRMGQKICYEIRDEDRLVKQVLGLIVKN